MTLSAATVIIIFIDNSNIRIKRRQC